MQELTAVRKVFVEQYAPRSIAVVPIVIGVRFPPLVIIQFSFEDA